MASELRVNTLKDAAGANSVALSTVANGSAKHFVWFDGNTSNTIQASFNNSSVTDNGTGDYSPVLTNAMSSTFSILTAMSYRTSRYTCTGSGVSMSSTSGYDLDCTNSSTTFTDTEIGSQLDGDLA